MVLQGLQDGVCMPRIRVQRESNERQMRPTKRVRVKRVGILEVVALCAAKEHRSDGTQTGESMEELLAGIESPADVKRLTIPQLTQLAEEIRERLILGVSKTGGHIGPNLGVVELTLAMHYVFDTPRDSFVFDVSHQAYVHKMLTGRNDRFETIRQPGGLNGFMLRTESEHDSYGAGHAGTALSAALGMAVARDMSGGKEHIVALCGDAAFTNGISFEALNNIAAQTRRLIVVLNDNAWSIDKNVGAIAEYFHKIVTNPTMAATARSRGRHCWSGSAARRCGTWRARRKRRPRD